MTDEQPNIDERTAEAAVQRSDAPAAVVPVAEQHDPLYASDGDWLDDADELPPRPRRRLLTPIPLTLLAILAIACGFIAGVLVEKGQGGSSGTGGGVGGFAGRLATASGRSSVGSASSSGSGFTAAAGGGGTQGGSGAAGAGAGSSSATARTNGREAGAGATIGQVAYVSKDTLYVTTLEGNTVKVTAAPGATVTKSVKTKAAGIHPGETVVVTGSTSASGAISAQSIRAGSATGGLGGAAGLFGGSGAASRGTSSSGGGTGSGASGASGSSGGGEQALFGNG
jgi:hypothetical protein